MFGIAASAGTRFVQLVGALALVGMLAGVVLRATDDRQPDAGVLPSRPTLAQCSEVSPRDAATLLYRERQFERAAAIIGQIRPTDVDLQNLALQYERLGRSWRVAMDPASTSIDAFEALAEARKLDVVLGSAHTDTLEARMRLVAPRAALAYMERKDYPAAELALHTAESLGVHDSSTALVGETLAAIVGPQ